MAKNTGRDRKEKKAEHKERRSRSEEEELEDEAKNIQTTDRYGCFRLKAMLGTEAGEDLYCKRLQHSWRRKDSRRI